MCGLSARSRVPLVATFVVLCQAGAAFSQAGRKPPQWQQPDYQRDVDAYERTRDADYQEERVLDIVGVRPGMVIGEVGASNGYFALKLARPVGPTGKIYANDILEDYSLAELRYRAEKQGLANIETILGTETDPRLPQGRLDMVFLVRVLHDLTKPIEVLEKITASLKPGARVVVVEVEREVPDGRSASPQTRQQFLDIVNRSALAVERIDKSLPNPASVVMILKPRGR